MNNIWAGSSFNTLESSWCALSNISHCTNDLYAPILSCNTKNYRSNPVQLWNQITYTVVTIIGKIILLTLFFSVWTDKGDGAGSWGKSAFGVSGLNKSGSSAWLPWQQHNQDASSPIATASSRGPNVWVKAFSPCHALFESTSIVTPWGASCKDTERPQGNTKARIISHFNSFFFFSDTTAQHYYIKVWESTFSQIWNVWNPIMEVEKGKILA